MAPKLGTDHIKETLQQEGERATRDITDRAATAGLETTTSIREGAPADVITGYADTVEADAIVMGTNGRTGMNRLLLGSVAERVIQTTDLSVTTVKSPTDEAGDS
jgi:nucleotide-binding universal stress UspA family protein